MAHDIHRWTGDFGVSQVRLILFLKLYNSLKFIISGQIEHRYKDGTVEIHYVDGSIRISNKNWTNDVKEEWRMPDGVNAKIFNNGTKILSFPNGQREVHTTNHKRREYPDGTVKLMYADGTLETRYSNGRVRVKDKDGNLISDNMKS